MRLEKTFEPEISVKPGCHYKIAFTSLETYYSIPNINESNNTFQVSQSDGSWETITLQKGCYGLMDLNADVGRQLEDLGMHEAVQFKANYNTFKCVMIIKANFGVRFTTTKNVCELCSKNLQGDGKNNAIYLGAYS